MDLLVFNSDVLRYDHQVLEATNCVYIPQNTKQLNRMGIENNHRFTQLFTVSQKWKFQVHD